MVRSLCLLLAIGAIAFGQGVRGAAPVTPANTGRRVALVIGNRAYPRKPLMNSVNDARDVGALLQDQLGFRTTVKTDLNQEAMVRAVEDFLSQVQSGDIALFYYAGHGMQVDGQNLLLPVDFDATDDIAAKVHGYQANQLSGRLRGRGARTSIVILDACRDNPFRSWRSDSGGGLAGMSGSGAFIAFAADEGKTADDNPRDRNGLFTKHLLAELRQPGLTIDEVFNGVRASVFQESNGRQTPFVSSGLIGTFRFREGLATAPALDLDVERYTAVKDSRDPAQLEAVAITMGRADLAGILRERARSLRSLSTPAPASGQGQQTPASGGRGLSMAELRKPVEAGALSVSSNMPDTWTDSKTGLMWTARDNGSPITQPQALAYCQNLSLADTRDWRLPTVDELQSIYDPDAIEGGIKHVKGSIKLASYYAWSSSRGTFAVDALVFGFLSGNRTSLAVNSPSVMHALCVRNARK
jgi:hypothetical protein